MAAEAGLVSIILSDPIAAELREKLIEKFNVPQEDADAVVDHLKTYAELASAPGRSGWVVPDPDDDKFIDTALAAGAGIIVSGDRHLLDLGTVEPPHQWQQRWWRRARWPHTQRSRGAIPMNAARIQATVAHGLPAAKKSALKSSLGVVLPA